MFQQDKYASSLFHTSCLLHCLSVCFCLFLFPAIPVCFPFHFYIFFASPFLKRKMILLSFFQKTMPEGLFFIREIYLIWSTSICPHTQLVDKTNTEVGDFSRSWQEVNSEYMLVKIDLKGCSFLLKVFAVLSTSFHRSWTLWCFSLMVLMWLKSNIVVYHRTCTI